MPNKHNDKCRHKFKKATYKVKNWAEYNDALRKRGDITVWFTEEAIQPWIPENTGKKGRPQKYSNLAIETCLFLRMVCSLPLRQTEGFARSLVRLMGLCLNVPDYSTLSKRSINLELSELAQTLKPGSHFIIDSTGLKVYGKDEWHQDKHGVNPKKSPTELISSIALFMQQRRPAAFADTLLQRITFKAVQCRAPGLSMSSFHATA